MISNFESLRKKLMQILRESYLTELKMVHEIIQF